MAVPGIFTGFPLKIRSNPPICSSVPERVFSRSMIVKVSSSRPHFSSKSTGVFEVMEGLGLRRGIPRIDLKQPRLELGVKENVESVELEAVLVVDDDLLHCL